MRKMKINQKKVILADIETENINGELIIYNIKCKKIVILNATSSFIWDYICQSYSDNIDLCSFDVVRALQGNFNMEGVSEEEVLKDVDECIEKLFEAELLEWRTNDWGINDNI